MNRPNFPGMNPYLERPDIWPEIHYGLISGLMRSLNPLLVPKYRAAVDKRTYMDSVLVGIPDTTVIQSPKSIDSQQLTGRSAANLQAATTILSKPEIVSVPIQEEVTERFLEIRETATGKVVTVIEVLSPKNKQGGEGRLKYLKKRQMIFSSQTHFVEIDLLRMGQPMPIQGGRKSSYQILVSRVDQRPSAERYPFDMQHPIPVFTLPLMVMDTEPVIQLNKLIDQAYQEAALDLVIDYSQPPAPPLGKKDRVWLESLLN
ncbi:MAG: DUF4058 family protein [Cyanobacteria bacterium P01_F01_bin.150]